MDSYNSKSSKNDDSNKIHSNLSDYENNSIQEIENLFYKYEYDKGINRPLHWRFISKFPSLYILYKIRETGFKKAFSYLKSYKSIKKNNLFDIAYYLKNYPEVRSWGIDPVLHYFYYGFKENKKPSKAFDGYEYLKDNPDVKKANLNPLVHYSLYGIKEDRSYFSNENEYNLDENSLSSKYINDLFNNAYKKSDDFIEYNKNNFELSEDDIKLIAFYLPQYHPFKENDKWWGKGFTEWNNVTRALPMFTGHKQPQLPIELGFYDLRIAENIKNQVDLAKNYGIYGFCFYYYWFSGHKLMEEPLEIFLENIDFPFCICWANENWTRRWDGKEDDILISQDYLEGDDLKLIEDLYPLLSDERYIKINNKPLLLIYKLTAIPNLKESVDRWRNYCREKGLGEIEIVGVGRTEVNENPEYYGLDSFVDFPPNNPHPSKRVSVDYIHPDYKPSVFDMENFLANELSPDNGNKFKAIFPSWDNTARRLEDGQVYLSSPELYERWLKELINYTKENLDEQFIFINAWNEWAEGAHLEPDRYYGYAYLKSTFDAIKYTKKIDINELEDNYKVSIIMPTYNRANIIKRAIDSIINQTFKNFELIICDDGSTDETEEIVKNYNDGRIIYIKQANRGVSSARNTALKEAKGDLIAYLDSDNKWNKRFLERMVNVFYLNENCLSAYSAILVEDKHDDPIYGENSFIRREKYSRDKLLESNFIDLNTYVHKKSLYEENGGFNESLNSLVDWDLILRYTKNHNPIFLDEILVEYFLDESFNNITYKINHDEDYRKLKSSIN